MSTRFQRLSRLVLITTLLMALIGGLVPTAAQDDIPWPTNGWLTSTPEEQGVDSAKLLILLDQIERQKFPLDSLTIIRHGHIVLDAYFQPFESDTKHMLFSATKSFTSALVGVAMQQGYIQSVDQPVLELLPGYTAADPRWSEITLRHVLTMTAGFTCGSDIEGLGVDVSNWTQAILNAPVTMTPGTFFNYCGLSSHLLSAIVGASTGIPSADFAHDHLFRPLGITDYLWSTDPQGNVTGHSGLWLSARDMAKLGYLYLHNGQWEGQQLIPAEYAVDTVTNQCGHIHQGPQYGYQWWMMATRVPGYQAWGLGGQHVGVVPERDLVVVITNRYDTVGDTSGVDFLASSLAIRAAEAEAPLPANAAVLAQLEDKIAALTRPAPRVADPVPDYALARDGDWIVFREPLDLAVLDAVQLESIRLDVGTNARQVTLGMRYADGSTLDVPVGLDGLARVTDSPFGSLAADGRWIEGVGLLRARLYVRGAGNTAELSIYLTEDPVRVCAKDLDWSRGPCAYEIRQT